MTGLLRAVAAAACALAFLVAPPAHATGSDFYDDCSFRTVTQDAVTGPDVYTGYAYATVVLYSRDHGNVVNATVTCQVLVNGVPQWSSSKWGSGAVAFADTVRYVATDVDDVDLCTTVDFTSDDTPTLTRCATTTTTEFPPNRWVDFFVAFLDWFDRTVAAPWAPTTPPMPPVWPLNDQFVPTGAGYNTGDAGYLVLAEDEAAAACAYATDRATGTLVVAGTSNATVRCVLTDTATGAVLYDETGGSVLHGTVPAHAGPVTVCTGGTGTLRCRPGEPLVP